MWLNNIFQRDSKTSETPLFGETFLRRLERLSFRTAPSLRGVMAGERRSRNLRPALDFSDHRVYTRGDDLRYIDWKTYSRHEELFVKLGEAPQSVNVHILIDCSRSMSWMTLQRQTARKNGADASILSKWDAARRLAGALSYLSLSGGERLFITPFTPDLGTSFGPTQGKRQIIPALKYISALAPAPAARGNTAEELTQSLTTYAHSHPQGGFMIIISDLLDAAASAETGKGADWLAEGLRHLPPPRWQVIVMHMLSEQEVNPDFEGDFELQDMETGERLPFRIDQQVLSQYRLRVRRWCSELQTACGQRASIYARIQAEWPFEQMVIPYLRQRGAFQ